MIQTKSIPPPGVLRPHVVALFSMCIVSVVISASCNTASLFCKTTQGGNSKLVERDSSVATYVKLAYLIAYMIPAGVMNIFNLVGFGISSCYIYVNVREVLPLLRRLMVNNLIIMMLYIPAAALFIATTNDIAMRIGSLLISSAGVFFSISYFYFSIYVDKLMPNPFLCLIQSDNIVLRSLLVSPSSTSSSSSHSRPSSISTPSNLHNISNPKTESSMFELRESSLSVAGSVPSYQGSSQY